MASTPARRLPPGEKVLAVLDVLAQSYGRAQRLERDPLEVLIRGVLSQNTSDLNSGRAYRHLRQRFGSWEALAEAGIEQIEAAIREGGLAGQKALTIRGIMQWLDGRKERSLEHLRELPPEEAERLLTKLKGVGTKTARLVLLFGFGRPVFVVDTHVFRVTKRLGIIPDGATREKAHRLLDEIVPGRHKYSGHVNLIRHGRQTCRARGPLCGSCPVRAWCLSVQGDS